MKFQFSGHDKFKCKHFWLKKAYDFRVDNNKFTDDQAVVNLGVGKNMVTSIRYWSKSFGILDEDDKISDFAHYIFSDQGKDPFCEDVGTIWLLHYKLATINKASLYNIFFNYFIKERLEFNKDHLFDFIKIHCQKNNYEVNENTLQSDISVFLKSYIRPKRHNKNIEDSHSGLLQELNIFKEFEIDKINEEQKIWYRVQNNYKEGLPYQIVLFTILNQLKKNDKSISFREMLKGLNSPGLIFALKPNDLYQYIQKITNEFESIIFSETAGNQLLQFNSNFDKLSVLDDYYS